MEGGTLDEPLKQLATKHDVTVEQVLLAWVSSKGVPVVTLVYFSPWVFTLQDPDHYRRKSSKEERLLGYLRGVLLLLTDEDISALETATNS